VTPHKIEVDKPDLAAELFTQTKIKGLSFADRAALTLGILRYSLVVTADKRFAEAGLPVKVRLIRGRPQFSESLGTLPRPSTL
jgi:PIN domain nuclease of toxin-antitoxin system